MKILDYYLRPSFEFNSEIDCNIRVLSSYIFSEYVNTISKEDILKLRDLIEKNLDWKCIQYALEFMNDHQEHLHNFLKQHINLNLHYIKVMKNGKYIYFLNSKCMLKYILSIIDLKSDILNISQHLGFRSCNLITSLILKNQNIKKILWRELPYKSRLYILKEIVYKNKFKIKLKKLYFILDRNNCGTFDIIEFSKLRHYVSENYDIEDYEEIIKKLFDMKIPWTPNNNDIVFEYSSILYTSGNSTEALKILFSECTNSSDNLKFAGKIITDLLKEKNFPEIWESIFTIKNQ
jgi:hypothetical protein